MAFRKYRFPFSIALAVAICTVFGGAIALVRAKTIARSEPTDAGDRILRQSTAFFCDETSQPPALVARSDLGNARFIVFETSFGTATPLMRCREIAKRFVKLQEKRNMGYLTWARVPGGQAIHVAKHEGDLFRSPEHVDLLFSMKPEDKPHEILESLHGILSTLGDPTIVRN